LDIFTVSKLILAGSLVLYGIHVFLVIRRILRKTSSMRQDLGKSAEPPLLDDEDASHKIVNSVFEFEEDPFYGEIEEKR